jgi:DNA-binding transcriptional regulator YdaS (Cro superfamily)
VDIYRLVWRSFCAVFGLLGLVSAFILLPGKALISLAIAGGTISLATVVTWRSRDDGSGDRWPAGRSVLAVAVAGAALPAAAGFGYLIGGGVVFVLLLLGLSSPLVIIWCGSKVGWAPESASSAERVLPTVSTAEICRQWEDSYAALNAVGSAARLRIVMARQRCLDELERRDPAGLNAWLSSSAASAGGNPRPFLSANADDPADGTS